MNTRAAIKKCPLFSGVTEEDLDRLEQICRLRNCNRGEVLFSQGEEAKGFYIIAEGRIKIYKLSADGKERILHIVHPGDSFAEAAIFGDGRYPAFAETLIKSSVVYFPRQEFLDLLHRHAQIAINMVGGLSRFLRQFATQIEELTFKDVPARLAQYLVDLSDEGNAQSVELPISKSQLASRLGTVSETLSRTLRKLSDEQVLAVNGKIIRILDYDRLVDLAESTRES